MVQQHTVQYCTVTVVSASAASQKRFRSSKSSFIRKLMLFRTKNTWFCTTFIFYHRAIVKLDRWRFAIIIKNTNGTGGKFCRYRRWYRWCTLTCKYLRELTKKIEMILMIFSPPHPLPCCKHPLILDPSPSLSFLFVMYDKIVKLI